MGLQAADATGHVPLDGFTPERLGFPDNPSTLMLLEYFAGGLRGVRRWVTAREAFHLEACYALEGRAIDFVHTTFLQFDLGYS